MKTNNQDARIFDGIQALDKVIHEPARISILTLLYFVDSADFLYIMGQAGLTQGNLSFHMTKLEAAGYIIVEKRFKNKRPNTLIRISDRGREEYKKYILTLRQFVKGIEL